MKFRTPLEVQNSAKKIDLSDPILTIGSCFSDSIGNILIKHKFDAFVNPFGTIFDPLSISRLLTYSLNDQSPAAETYIQSEGVYKNMELHSSFSGLSQDELSLKIKARLTTTGEFLSSAKWLIITFGTAHVYKYKKSSQYIANCQKMPAKNFTKELISIDHLTNSFKDFTEKILKFNPSLNIILTVSPVRHLKDGILENSLSKAILRVLCSELATQYESVQYYPAYEIMIDDLRDYRFYQQDMIHPSNQAIDYIWDHFSKSYINDTTLDFIGKWGKIRSALRHKPFNPATSEHQQFLKKTLKDLNELKKLVSVDKEISLLKDQILNVS